MIHIERYNQAKLIFAEYKKDKNLDSDSLLTLKSFLKELGLELSLESKKVETMLTAPWSSFDVTKKATYPASSGRFLARCCNGTVFLCELKIRGRKYKWADAYNLAGETEDVIGIEACIKL